MQEVATIQDAHVERLDQYRPRTQTFMIRIDNDLINHFLKDTQAQTETTKRTYKTGINQFVQYIGKDNLQPTHDDVLNFVNSMKQEGKAPSTIQTYTVAVRLFFKWAENRSLYLNIARDIKA